MEIEECTIDASQILKEIDQIHKSYQDRFFFFFFFSFRKRLQTLESELREEITHDVMFHFHELEEQTSQQLREQQQIHEYKQFFFQNLIFFKPTMEREIGCT